jgi:2-amino-4-hydroxy-6-hydroxymethyldihydropteridine diphosphokinase
LTRKFHVPTDDLQRPTGIALGSNLGDRLAHLVQGRDLLFSLHEGAAPAACSRVYQTEPVDCPPGSAPFLNAVVEIRTSLNPDRLLRQLIRLESELGRSATRGRNTPRPLDLDILYSGELVADTPTLVLPHPRMAARRFVLQPLADVRPDFILPGDNRPVTQLLAALPAAPRAEVFRAAW